MRKERNITIWRFYSIIVCFLVFTAMIFFRLFWLQVKQNNYYTALAEKQYRNKKDLLPQRGEIFFQGGENRFAAAVNKEMNTVYVVPMEIKNDDKVINLLSEVLGVDKEIVRHKVEKKNDPYEVIKRKLTEEESNKIKEAALTGVHFEKEKWRYYPGNELGSQVLGFLGYGDKGMSGRYGVEQYFNNLLAGRKGYVEEDSDVAGRWISIGDRLKHIPENGSDLLLTINQTIQFKAELALKNAVKKHGADGGKILIIEPQTGKILAMASYPNFNPNEYSKYKSENMRNPIVSDTYEPGSVMKIITMAAGLDAGKVSPGTTYTDTGAVLANGFTIKNSDEKAYGLQTMTEVIEKSLNTGVIFVEKLLGHRLFADYLHKFGFGEKSGIELPGEVKGSLRNLQDWRREVNFYTASFGQGVAVTPLQLGMAYGVIANKGVLLKPLIVDTIIKPDGRHEKKRVEIKKQVISEESARQATEMLVSNVINGHGKLAGVPGYRVAGKTGTAQIPDRVHGGYIEGATIGTFAGFAPADDPKFVMVVIIDHPRDTEWAAGTAAPVFGELSRFLLEHFSVPPTEKYDEEDLLNFDKKHDYLRAQLSSEEEGDESQQKE